MSDDPFDLEAALAKHVKKPSEVATPQLALLYSQPGGGKTWLAASICEVEGVDRVLILDTEGSTVGSIAEFPDAKIDIVSVERDTPEESFMFLNTILDHLSNSATVSPYDAVVIDTFDVAQDWAIKYFKENAPTNDKGNIDGWAVWGSVGEWSADTARMLKRIPAKAVLVIHDREEKSKDGMLTKRLNLAGKAKDILPGIPDMVMYLERKLEGDEEVTYAHMATQDAKVTKNRFHFPPVVKNPRMKSLYEYAERQVEKNDPSDG